MMNNQLKLKNINVSILIIYLVIYTRIYFWKIYLLINEFYFTIKCNIGYKKVMFCSIYKDIFNNVTSNYISYIELNKFSKKLN